MKSKSLSSKIFLSGAMIGMSFSGVVVLLMHFLNRDYSPMSRYISEYANGNYGNLASFSFTVFGLSIIMFSLWLQRTLSGKLKSKLGLKLILLSGIVIIILGFFNIDPKMAKPTFYGTIHGLSTGIGFFSFSIGSLMLSRKFKSDILSALSWFSLFLLLLVILGAFVDFYYSYFFIPEFLKIFSSIVGLIERLYFLIITLWIGLAFFFLQ